MKVLTIVKNIMNKFRHVLVERFNLTSWCGLWWLCVCRKQTSSQPVKLPLYGTTSLTLTDTQSGHYAAIKPNFRLFHSPTKQIIFSKPPKDRHEKMQSLELSPTVSPRSKVKNIWKPEDNGPSPIVLCDFHEHHVMNLKSQKTSPNHAWIFSKLHDELRAEIHHRNRTVQK